MVVVDAARLITAQTTMRESQLDIGLQSRVELAMCVTELIGRKMKPNSKENFHRAKSSQ